MPQIKLEFVLQLAVIRPFKRSLVELDIAHIIKHECKLFSFQQRGCSAPEENGVSPDMIRRLGGYFFNFGTQG